MIDVLKRTPPPIYFVVFFAIGYGIHTSILNLELMPGLIANWLGGVSVVVSVALIAPTLVQFRKADTPFDVRRPPTHLVTRGAFAFSRNPGYLALVLLYAGGALLINSVVVLILILPAFLLVNGLIIPAEEAALETVFGDEYRGYRSRVRRWI